VNRVIFTAEQREATNFNFDIVRQVNALEEQEVWRLPPAVVFVIWAAVIAGAIMAVSL
jgi:ABC-type enterochelin transport system substrate-binding protein